MVKQLKTYEMWAYNSEEKREKKTYKIREAVNFIERKTDSKL